MTLDDLRKFQAALPDRIEWSARTRDGGNAYGVPALDWAHAMERAAPVLLDAADALIRLERIVQAHDYSICDCAEPCENCSEWEAAMGNAAHIIAKMQGGDDGE